MALAGKAKRYGCVIIFEVLVFGQYSAMRFRSTLLKHLFQTDVMGLPLFRTFCIYCLTFLIDLIRATAPSTGCAPRAVGNAPVAASGYDAQLVLSNLSSPRGIKFDSRGHLLVVEDGVGIKSYSLVTDPDGCTSSDAYHAVVQDATLNHGIELSLDGRTLFASSADSVYSWPYDPVAAMISGVRDTIITNMSTTDHVTRTLLMSRKQPGTLVVSRGSASNLDPLAREKSSGHSQVKAFDLLKMQSAFDFDSDGVLLGWGLRNDVGLDEHPITGGIYSVENSVDELERDGVDIHQNNPGEEMNFLGYLNGTKSVNQGGNFGYPDCFSAWNVSDIPMNAGITVGSQFAIGDETTAAQDQNCRDQRIGPELVFQAHMAPLDISFNMDGTEAWITFHGSWDREPAVGYKLSKVKFTNGKPVAEANSNSAAIDVVSNQGTGSCNDPSNHCFRPVGLAWDNKETLLMSSDATGEIYAIRKKNASATSQAPSEPSSSTSVAIKSLVKKKTAFLGVGLAAIFFT